jgi:hypothetical protein
MSIAASKWWAHQSVCNFKKLFQNHQYN